MTGLFGFSQQEISGATAWPGSISWCPDLDQSVQTIAPAAAIKALFRATSYEAEVGDDDTFQ
jgi:hypothetical protein